MTKTFPAFLLLPLALFAAQCAASASETVLEVDFSKSTKTVHQKAKGSFEGILPEACSADFAGWNSSSATSRLLSEDGRGFLRINVTQFDKGVLFSFPLKELKAPGHYKLTVLCRLSSSDISFGIRQFPAPYKTFCSVSIPALSNDWTEKSFPMTIREKAEPPVGFFIYPGLGDVDLASLKLIRLSTEEVASSVQRPPADCANFFRNSRFPLGLQAGWNISRDSDRGRVEADHANPGPSGQPSLLIQSDKQIAVFSEPFQTSAPLKRNVSAFSCKGSGSWKCAVIQPNGTMYPREIASRSFKLSKDWSTETIEIKIDSQSLVSKAFSLKFSGTGSLNIDSLQAWAGEPERKYLSQGECEVALGFPKSELSDERIQLEGEAPALNYCVTGAFEGAVLKIKVVNAYGEEKEPHEIKLGKSGAGTLNYDVFPDCKLGQFRVEASVERDGRRISPLNEMLVTRIKRAVHMDEDAPDSQFGAHFLPSPLTMRMMKAAGVNWARLHDTGTEYIGWYHLETEKGKWTFHDEEIKLYRDNHIKIFAGLQTVPKWASLYADSGKKDFHAYYDRYFEPKSLDDWSNYVRTVAARYKGVIDDFFIWNEPWGGFWHSGYDLVKKNYISPPLPGEFAKLSLATYKAAKEGNPSAKVAGFDTTAGEAGQKWTKGVFDAGAYAGCDAVDYHFYTAADQGLMDDQVHQAFHDAIGYIKEQIPGFDKPVIMSEGQGNCNGSFAGAAEMTGIFKHSITWQRKDNPLLNADKTCRFVVSNLASGCSRIFLYSTHTYACLAVDPIFLTLLGPDGYPHVEFAAFSNMAFCLEDRKFVRTVKLNDNCCAFIFQGRGSTVAVISGRRNASWLMPKKNALTACDLFGNPLLGERAKYSGNLIYVRSALDAESLIKELQSK